MPTNKHSSLIRTPGDISSNWLQFVREITPVEWGLGGASTSSGTIPINNRYTAFISLKIPFFLTAVRWVFHAAGDYDVSFVADRDSGLPDVLYTIDAAWTATAGADQTVTPPTPIILLPGTHFLGALWSGAAEHIRYFADTAGYPYEINSYMSFCGSWTSTTSANQAPAKFVGYPIYTDIDNFMIGL